MSFKSVNELEFTFGKNPDAKVFLNGMGFTSWEDYKDHKVRLQQLGVATYFIDKLALRVGNEKDTDAEADTVGCSTLRVEHIQCMGEVRFSSMSIVRLLRVEHIQCMGEVR